MKAMRPAGMSTAFAITGAFTPTMPPKGFMGPATGYVSKKTYWCPCGEWFDTKQEYDQHHVDELGKHLSMLPWRSWG